MDAILLVAAVLWAAVVLWLMVRLGWLDVDDRAERARMRRRLREAGFGGWALEVYSAIRVLLALALPLAVVPALMGVASPGVALAAVVATAWIGYCAPGVWLGVRLRRRAR